MAIARFVSLRGFGIRVGACVSREAKRKPHVSGVRVRQTQKKSCAWLEETLEGFLCSQDPRKYFEMSIDLHG